MSFTHGNSRSDQTDQISCDSKIKSRKRTRNNKQHKIYQEKLKVQRGLEHTTKSGKTVEAKTFHGQTDCSCNVKCSQKIDIDRQKAIFEAFYTLENWSKKRLFLRSLIKNRPSKGNFNPVTTRKRTIYDYWLTDSCGNQMKVCFGFFSKCIQVSKDCIYRAIKTVISNETASDPRGRNSTRKTCQRDITFLKNFIKKFPSYHSHYGRSESDKKYLSPSLNIKRLYREYSIVCEFKKRKTLSEWKFRHIFNTEFNLGFRPKKVDTCRVCDKFEALIQSETTNTKENDRLLKQKEHHLRLVKYTKDTFKEAKDNANKVEVLTFDLQRALELPLITTSEAFYRRQLWCYNLCIYDEKRKKGYMYFWNESVASRGSQEISSCLKKHFAQFIPEDTEKIVLYSDACGGQNRNIKTTLMIKKMLDSWPHNALLSIEQRFFVPGHSYNSCDRCFGVIERQKKITDLIYVPQHWMNIIKQAKKTAPEFTVIEMSKEDFFSCKQLESIITNRKKCLNKDKVDWMKIQKITNERSSPFNMIIERYSDCSIPPIQVSLRKRGKNSESFTFANAFFEPLYTESRPIKRKKYDDLQKLLQYVPSQFQWFFTSLKCEAEEPKSKRAKKTHSNADNDE